MIREAAYEGNHTWAVVSGLARGILLFILREVIFFSAFFWAFTHASLRPDPTIGLCWPPTSFIFLDPLGVPLLNTVILLSRGVRVTLAHHAVLFEQRKAFLFSIGVTLVLGVSFTGLQVLEYCVREFSINDSIFGATFFVSTGFHGVHVIIGRMFLFVCFLRALKVNFSSAHHFGLLAAIWY